MVHRNIDAPPPAPRPTDEQRRFARGRVAERFQPSSNDAPVRVSYSLKGLKAAEEQLRQLRDDIDEARLTEESGRLVVGWLLGILTGVCLAVLLWRLL